MFISDLLEHMMNTIKLEALSPLSTITDQKLYEAILERVK